MKEFTKEDNTVLVIIKKVKNSSKLRNKKLNFVPNGHDIELHSKYQMPFRVFSNGDVVIS